MSQIAAGLDCIEKAFGSLSAPGLEDSRIRQLIKGIINLYRLKHLSIKLKPLAHWLSFGVKAPPPVLVIPSRAADMDFAFPGHLLLFRPNDVRLHPAFIRNGVVNL